jgi:hypothetical protein
LASYIDNVNGRLTLSEEGQEVLLDKKLEESNAAYARAANAQTVSNDATIRHQADTIARKEDIMTGEGVAITVAATMLTAATISAFVPVVGWIAGALITAGAGAVALAGAGIAATATEKESDRQREVILDLQSVWDPATESMEKALREDLNINDEDLINTLKAEEDSIRDLIVSNAEVIAANEKLEATMAKQIAHEVDIGDKWTDEEEDLIGQVVAQEVTQSDKNKAYLRAEKWSSGDPEKDKAKAEEWLKMTYGPDALEKYRITDFKGDSFTIEEK